jgi:hypothetical protein
MLKLIFKMNKFLFYILVLFNFLVSFKVLCQTPMKFSKVYCLDLFGGGGIQYNKDQNSLEIIYAKNITLLGDMDSMAIDSIKAEDPYIKDDQILFSDVYKKALVLQSGSLVKISEKKINLDLNHLSDIREKNIEPEFYDIMHSLLPDSMKIIGFSNIDLSGKKEDELVLIYGEIFDRVPQGQLLLNRAYLDVFTFNNGKYYSSAKIDITDLINTFSVKSIDKIKFMNDENAIINITATYNISQSFEYAYHILLIPGEVSKKKFSYSDCIDLSGSKKIRK